MNTDYKVAEIKLSYKNKTSLKSRKKIQNSRDAYEYLACIFDNDTIDYKESFKVLYLNRAHHVIGYTSISEGGLDSTCVDVRNIMQGALLANAAAIILAHNHPSGEKRPSVHDIEITRKISNAGKILDITVADHIIITRNSYYSFSDENYM